MGFEHTADDDGEFLRPSDSDGVFMRGFAGVCERYDEHERGRYFFFGRSGDWIHDWERCLLHRYRRWRWGRWWCSNPELDICRDGHRNSHQQSLGTRLCEHLLRSIREWDDGDTDCNAHRQFEFWRVDKLRYRPKRKSVLGYTYSQQNCNSNLQLAFRFGFAKDFSQRRFVLLQFFLFLHDHLP